MNTYLFQPLVVILYTLSLILQAAKKRWCIVSRRLEVVHARLPNPDPSPARRKMSSPSGHRMLRAHRRAVTDGLVGQRGILLCRPADAASLKGDNASENSRRSPTGIKCSFPATSFYPVALSCTFAQRTRPGQMLVSTTSVIRLANCSLFCYLRWYASRLPYA